MGSRLRIGIIGTGGIARGHARRLAEIEGVQIAALADPSQASLASFGQAVLNGGPRPATYDHHRRMLEKEKLDAVLVSSPHTLHFEQIMDALDAGLHVLAEKPLACSTEHARAIIEKSRSAGRHVVVSYQRRFKGVYRYMKQLLRSPEFGPVCCLSSFLSQGWLRSQSGTWRQDPELSGGGQLNDSGSHIVDMIFWMLEDEVDQVSAFIENRGCRVDIDSAVTFRTRAGTLGTLTVVGSGPDGFMWEDISITGANGHGLFLRRGQLWASLGSGELVSYERLPADTDQDRHFVEVISGRTQNQSPPEDFLRTIRFTEAAWESAAQGGRPVSLAERS